MRSQGEFIQFLDSDDILAPEKIMVQMSLLKEGPADRIASCAWSRFHDRTEEAVFVREAVWQSIDPVHGWLHRGWVEE